jgi:hypothetical protein
MGYEWLMSARLEAASIRCGGTEAVVEAINAKISELEAERGIRPARTRATIHETTWRSWVRGARPRYPLVIQAVCEVTGTTPETLGWVGDTVEDVDRRGFLTGSAAAVISGTVLPLLGELGAPPRPDVDDYAGGVARLWQACWTADPVKVAYTAADQIEHGRVLLGRSRGREQRRIADSIGLAGILVGRVAFFDLGRPGVADEVWRTASVYLDDSDDHSLKACLHGHRAFLPGWSGRWTEAESELRLASGYARRGGGPSLRAWLHAVAAECQTKSGRSRGALDQIERAHDTLAAGGAWPDPWWLDYFDGTRLDGFDAATALAFGREVLSAGKATPVVTRHALDRVERALTHLHTSTEDPDRFAPQDCVTVLDRGLAHALIHDDDKALSLAADACRVLARRPYAAARSRLDDLADTLPTSRMGDLREIERAYLAA